MALAKDAYRELEDILGPENISEDLAVLDGYSYLGPMGSEFGFGQMSFISTRPEAVVLPGSTGEVQAVLKWCNRRGIKSHAFSTGYGPMGASYTDGEILLDMRRMNRILEIDEKNMYIVVEPYVCFAQVQAEVHKRKLNCHVIGAGSNCSYLASHTSMHGTNTQSLSHGWSGRNLLGAEWVLPTGEILKLGSLGSRAGWFSGDGPGPSLRGILRGAAGAMGGLGVFTKCAGHLHPWPGSPEMEIKGVSPYYETEIPPLFEYRWVEWPTWEKCADAQYKIGRAGIAFAMHKTGGPGSHGASVTGSNNEYYEKWEELKHIPWISYVIVMAGNSPEEHAYQVKTLARILEDTGGSILPLGEQRIMKNRDYINMIKGCFIPRTAFRATGTFTCFVTASDSVDHGVVTLRLDEEANKYRENGVIMDDGTNNMWGVAFEGGHWALSECGHFFDPTDEESIRGMEQMKQEGSEINLKTPLAGNWQAVGPLANALGPSCGNFQKFMSKIKKALDPNTASDPLWYASAEEESDQTKRRLEMALTVDSTIGDLLADEKSKAILEKHIPELLSHPQLSMATAMSLKAVAGFPEAGITAEKLQAISEGLSKI